MMRTSHITRGLFVLFLCLLTACTSVKNMSFVQDLPQGTALPTRPEFIIETGDLLNVSVQSINGSASDLFNTGYNYVVDVDGVITMPVLGKVAVEGKTLEQAKILIASLIADKVQNAFVSMSFTAATLSIIGEVNTPQKIYTAQPITIWDAIGTANGLTTNARYNKIEVLRTKNNQITKYILDLTSPELIQSPCYYLMKGDVVNVLPKYRTLTYKH